MAILAIKPKTSKAELSSVKTEVSSLPYFSVLGFYYLISMKHMKWISLKLYIMFPKYTVFSQSFKWEYTLRHIYLGRRMKLHLKSNN
jgi:hypothetical protein